MWLYFLPFNPCWTVFQDWRNCCSRIHSSVASLLTNYIWPFGNALPYVCSRDSLHRLFNGAGGRFSNNRRTATSRQDCESNQHLCPNNPTQNAPRHQGLLRVLQSLLHSIHSPLIETIATRQCQRCSVTTRGLLALSGLPINYASPATRRRRGGSNDPQPCPPAPDLIADRAAEEPDPDNNSTGAAPAGRAGADTREPDRV